MPNLGRNRKSETVKINAIDTTSERLTGRGGLALFVRYLGELDLMDHLDRLFGSMRKSSKALPVTTLFQQLFCFFLDGTSRHLVYFDHLRDEDGYAGTIETSRDAMASSHQVKRFFGAFSWPRVWLFRRLLQQLFLWRLDVEKPEVVVLGVDTMIMDNSEADVRHGVEPTYKRGVKSFQPLQVTWGRFMIDAVFRGGSMHSNYGNTVIKTIARLVYLVRTRYGAVPIIVRMDAGFFDQQLTKDLEELGVGYLIDGKLYGDILKAVETVETSHWGTYTNDHQQWEYLDFWDCRGRWDLYRRAILSRTLVEDNQHVLTFARTESILYTNIARSTDIGRAPEASGQAAYLEPDRLIDLYHGRGRDELVHRALKDFYPEELPFKRFAPIAAFYYVILVAFFHFEAFKEDVCAEIIPLTSYATRLRRRVIERIALNRHAQLLHACEVRLRTLTRCIYLLKEHLFPRAFQSPLALHLPLQRSELSVLKAARIAPLQVVEERLSIKAGQKLQVLPELLPHLCKHVFAPPHVCGDFSVEGSFLAFAYFRAVLTSIPVFSDAFVSDSPRSMSVNSCFICLSDTIRELLTDEGLGELTTARPNREF